MRGTLDLGRPSGFVIPLLTGDPAHVIFFPDCFGLSPGVVFFLFEGGEPSFASAFLGAIFVLLNSRTERTRWLVLQ